MISGLLRLTGLTKEPIKDEVKEDREDSDSQYSRAETETLISFSIGKRTSRHPYFY